MQLSSEARRLHLGLGVLLRLIWVCTVCLCPTKRTLGLYWLFYGIDHSNLFETFVCFLSE